MFSYAIMAGVDRVNNSIQFNSIQFIGHLDGWHTSKEDVRMTLNGAKEASCIGGIPIGTGSIDSNTYIISYYKVLDECFDNCAPSRKGGCAS